MSPLAGNSDLPPLAGNAELFFLSKDFFFLDSDLPPLAGNAEPCNLNLLFFLLSPLAGESGLPPLPPLASDAGL